MIRGSLERPGRRIAHFRFLGATMIGAYVVINVLMLALKPIVQGMSPFASTALLVPPMVLAMVFVVTTHRETRVRQRANTEAAVSPDRSVRCLR
jgi:hypothetical protein